MNALQALGMGFQLLWVDVLVSINLVFKQLRGEKVTERERKKIARTLADISTIAPFTILMLIPVSIFIPFHFQLQHSFQILMRLSQTSASKFVRHWSCHIFLCCRTIENSFNSYNRISPSTYLRPTRP